MNTSRHSASIASKVGRERVALLASTLYHPNVGGVENSLAHLSQALKGLGFRPWLLVSTGGDPQASRRVFEVKRMHGVPVFRYRFSSLAPIRLLRAWLGLRLLRRRLGVDAMVSRDQHSAVAAVLERQPCVYLVPGIHSEQHKPKGRNPLRWVNHMASAMMQRAALRRTPRVAVFSQAMADAVEREAGRDELELVRPGVEATRFTFLDCERRIEGRRRLGLPVDARVAVAVGRFAGLKRFDLAIGALSHMPDLWHLVLVGDGPERGRLERLVEDSGLTHRVHFAGQVPDPETYLQLADVYVLSSEKEAFGQVLIEAMACGLPIASFDPELPGVHTATNEVVPEEWLFKAMRKDAEALSAAMVEAVGAGCDPERIARWTRERYSWSALAAELVAFGSSGR